MAEKDKVCKECGFLSKEKECPNCGSKSFLDKYKGKVLVFNPESEVASKAGIKNNGKYALKYG